MEDLKTEIWKPIKGYEGLYEVSSLGNLRRKGKPKKVFPNSKGYLRTNLFKNGQGKHYLIHRLVADAFIPNPNDLPFIDHINTIRDDNRAENLRWCTCKENSNNPLTIEHVNIKNNSKEVKEKILATKRKNQSYRCEVPVYYIDEQGKKISFKSMREAQRQTNVYNISRSIAKKRPISGRQWYKEEKATAN